jgi:branched-chain amino acid aminotransferase
VALEACGHGCNLYIWPTLIATQPSPGVSASRHPALYVFLSPTGSYIRGTNNSSDATSGQGGFAPLAMGDQIRAWHSGTGGFKLGLNYAPGFAAQRPTAALGHKQLLWLLTETVAEAGAMNIFAVFDCADGGA